MRSLIKSNRSFLTPILFRRSSLTWLVTAAMAAMAACASVGPDYAPPESTPPAQWNTPLENGLKQDPMDPQTLAEWWSVFNDPALFGLMRQAVSGNLDLKQAESKIREARARRRIENAALFPAVDASADYSKNRSSENAGAGLDRDLYQAGFDAAWEIDIFGGIRRSVEAADTGIAASRENLRDVLVTLTAEIAVNYIDARAYQAKLAVAQANINSQQDTYELVQARYHAGLADELALQQARYNLESTRSKVPLLEVGLAGVKNRLAVLAGDAPGSVDAIFDEPRPIPVTPAAVAVGIPAETIKRRPDIRKTERELAYQTALVGVATADLYPKLRLAGTFGLASTDSGELLSSTSRFWNYGPGVSWNIFDAGAVIGNIEVQSALQEQALIAYESATLNALEEVENALVAYAQEQIRRDRLVEAAASAQQAETVAQAQYTAGLTDFSNVLDAQRSLFSFEEQLAESEGQVTSGLVRLYKALGGGWDSGQAFESEQQKDKDE
jgi:NodT family efflux transporter outer membrane factor (OMF) lipoprotein